QLPLPSSVPSPLRSTSARQILSISRRTFNTPSPARHTHFINSHFHSIRSEMRFTTIFVSIAAAYSEYHALPAHNLQTTLLIALFQLTVATGALAAPLPVDGAAAADLAARAEDTPAPRRNLEAV